MQYVAGKGFIPMSPLPKGKPVRGLKKIKNKPEYADVHVGMKKPRKKPVRKTTTRRKATTTNTKAVNSRPKKPLPKKRGFWGRLFG